MDTPAAENPFELLEKASSEFSHLEGNIVYARLASDLSNRFNDTEPRAIKIEGSVFLVLAKGKLSISYNFQNLEVEAPAALSFPPGTIVQIEPSDFSSTDAYVLGYTRAFLQDVNISFNAISGEALLERDSPALVLEESELKLLLRYVGLMRTVMTDNFNTQLSKHILSSLTSAIFYQLMLMLYKRIDTKGAETMGPRRGSYVHDFIKLVHLYYTKERSVSFYASKLFISPKYLSLLVKEATGRSAARWIDQFVIMEAKNLLRYSGKNIQQVAYDLNFSNQSSFGKYFKHLTGMSPTDFQKM